MKIMTSAQKSEKQGAYPALLPCNFECSRSQLRITLVDILHSTTHVSTASRYFEPELIIFEPELIIFDLVSNSISNQNHPEQS